MNAIQFKQITSSICLFALFSTSAMAQFVWLDDKNVKHYSDLPPPPSIPNTRILNMSNTPTQASLTKPPSPTLAEQDKAFQQRRIEKLQQNQASEQKAKQAANQAANCALARTNLRLLESEARIAQTSPNGQSVMIDAQQRAQQSAQNQEILRLCP